MVSVFIRENQHYELSELNKLFQTSTEKTITVLKKLKEVGIIKMISKFQRNSVLEGFLEEDLVLAEVGSNTNYYIFSFVGVIIISDLIINCFPKYISLTDKPIKEFKQILKVLTKYFNRKQEITFFENDSLTKSNSRLALYLFLIEDYFENGIYSKDLVIEEVNGNGEVNWNQTINRDSVLIDSNRPYYFELITKKRLSDKNNYVKKIHEIILTSISKELEETQLLNLFELTEIHLSDRELSEFGDNDLIIDNLEKELNIEFNTRKRLVILSLIAYLNQEVRINDLNSLTLFGTNSFNLVWEDVCQVILNNQLKQSLQLLSLPKPLGTSFNKNDSLQDLIEKPFWSITKNYARETFIPDIINIKEIDGDYYFFIFDAKYYTPNLELGKIPQGQPGIESIAKQYHYHLMYKEFINQHQFDFVKNFFILPTDKNEVIDKGQVRMEMMLKLGLEPIEIRLLPAQLAFKYYLKDQNLDLKILII